MTGRCITSWQGRVASINVKQLHHIWKDRELGVWQTVGLGCKPLASTPLWPLPPARWHLKVPQPSQASTPAEEQMSGDILHARDNSWEHLRVLYTTATGHWQGRNPVAVFFWASQSCVFRAGEDWILLGRNVTVSSVNRESLHLQFLDIFLKGCQVANLSRFFIFRGLIRNTVFEGFRLNEIPWLLFLITSTFWCHFKNCINIHLTKLAILTILSVYFSAIKGMHIVINRHTVHLQDILSSQNETVPKPPTPNPWKPTFHIPSSAFGYSRYLI